MCVKIINSCGEVVYKKTIIRKKYGVEKINLSFPHHINNK
jgi:hypothetical protein